MPVIFRNQPAVSRRPFVIYFILLLFVCVCLSMLIYQRLELSRRGERIITLHKEALSLRMEQCRLRLEVSRQGTYRNLVERAEQMNIRLVPPEEAAAPPRRP